MEIYKKLLKARDLIKSSKVEKEGLNKFSGYKYFTPSQISILVHDACKEVGLLHIYSMTHTELGHVANLIVIDVDKPEDKLLFTIPTSIPDIKATNEAQKLGGAVTYSERYLLMIAFDIVDNSLDFDTTENTQKQEKQVKKEENKKALVNGQIPQITDKFIKNWNGEQPEGRTVTMKDGKKFELTDEAFKQLMDFIDAEAEKMIIHQNQANDEKVLNNLFGEK